LFIWILFVLMFCTILPVTHLVSSTIMNWYVELTLLIVEYHHELVFQHTSM